MTTIFARIVYRTDVGYLRFVITTGSSCTINDS